VSNELKMSYVKMVAYPGAELMPCIHQAIQECLKYKCDVNFDFNCQAYAVDYSKLINMVTKQHE